MLRITILSLLFCVLGTHAFFFGSEDWNDLKVTWGINPFSSDNFQSLPRAEPAALKNGWKLEKDCSQINGRRYSKNGDRSVLLVFGANELIAGIAVAIPKNLPFNFPSKQVQPYLQDEGDVYTLTAYFVDPTTVCSKQAVKQSTGDRVVIKGASAELNIPLTEAEVESQKFWSKGKCFYTMGLHYWTDIRGIPLSKDTPSDYFFPMCLLYNKGKLNGFCWGLNANLTSPRLEHPTPSVLTQFINPVPDFMYDPKQTGILSTLHVYLDSTPVLNFC